jgi:hypothetical protein
MAEISETFANAKMEAKDRIKEIKNKLYVDKKQAKLEGEDSSSIVALAKQEIEVEKQKLADAKKVKIEAKMRAKSAYKELAKSEKVAIKEQKTAIKESAITAKLAYKDTIQNLDSNKPTVYVNKAEQMAQKRKIHEDKVGAKANYKNALIQDSVNRREQFVKQYNKLAA